jgi:nicotinate-nucleotide pyrophosphorylase (carboxylating)
VTSISTLLHPDAFVSQLAIDAAALRALDEDLGRAGDITSIATIPENTKARAVMVARQAGVIAGLPLAFATLHKLAPDLDITAHCRDGAHVAKGTHLLTIAGPARAILSAERTALNFVGRLSGIATLTAEYVRRTAGTNLRICCTRKTTPGLRALEKYAVRCGGGFNHRFGLDDAILIKDNHIAVAGGIRPVLERARAHAGHLVAIEIEVDTLTQLREVLDTGLAHVVLLDNMDIPTLAEAVKIAQGRVVLEASGGITLDSIAKIAATGVDYVSSGTLTHSAPNFDVALDIEVSARPSCRAGAGHPRLRSANDKRRGCPAQRPGLTKPLADSSYRRTEFGLSSASLLASSASSCEMAAVCAGVPQLGASLPSPQAFGR